MAQVHALKFMRKGQIVRYQQVDHIICEKRVLSQCDNPFILSLAGTNTVLSVLSVNSVLSILSVNSFLAIGCANSFMKICW